jgi:hypothetical protein
MAFFQKPLDDDICNFGLGSQWRQLQSSHPKYDSTNNQHYGFESLASFEQKKRVSRTFDAITEYLSKNSQKIIKNSPHYYYAIGAIVSPPNDFISGGQNLAIFYCPRCTNVH